MRTEYWPDSNLLRGKSYRPCASLTTVTVTVEPIRFTLTSTPSMGPSSCELTRPVSAGDGATWAMAVSVTEHATIVARPTRIRRKNRFVFIITPRIGLHAIRTLVDIRIAFYLRSETGMRRL